MSGPTVAVGTLPESRITSLTADLAARAMKARLPVNVMDYAGADNTGATSSTTALVNAEADAFILGRQLYAPAGTYLLSATFTPRVPFFGDGPGRTVLTRNGDFPHILTQGTKGSSISLSANATANAGTLTFTDAAAISSVSAQDFLILRSNVAWPGGSSGKTGEMVRVGSKTATFTANTANGSPNLTSISSSTAVVVGASISGTGIPGGTTISSVDRGAKTAVMSANATATNSATSISTSNALLGLEGPIDETYATADSSVVEKLSPVVGMALVGMTLQGTAGTSTSGGAQFKYCRNLVVYNVECRNLDGPGIQVETSVDWVVDACWIHDLTDDNAAGRIGYGINCMGASRDGHVTRCNIRNTRHSFTTNGSADGVPHHITVEDCEASGYGAIFDTHEEGRWIYFINCRVHATPVDGGTAFKVRCPDARIINPMAEKTSGITIDVFAARCHIQGGTIDTSSQAIRFESGATDGRVMGTAMTNAAASGGGGVRVDSGADRCIIQAISVRNMAEGVALEGGSGHHVKGIFVDGASNGVRVAAGASAVVRDLDTVNCTTELNNAGTVLNRGTATLVAGTVTVSNTLVKAGSRISLTVQSLGTVTTPKAIGVTGRTAGTSFTITSADATDTSVVAWEIQAA
jgi:hypothetical protein